MTALCTGGGPSQAKPGVDPIVTIASASAGAFVTALGFPELDFVVGLAAGGFALETATFCATDPPADPGLGQTDIANALNYQNPLVSIPALAKIKQWFEHQYWSTLCECTSGTTPAPAPPSNPGPLGQSTGLPGGSFSRCYVANQTIHIDGTGTTATSNLNAQMVPTGTPTVTVNSTYFGSPGHPLVCVPIPTGVTSWGYSVTCQDPATFVGQAPGIAVTLATDTGGVISESNIDDAQTTGTVTNDNIGFPNTVTHWGFQLGQENNLPVGSSHNWTFELWFNCPGNFASPCCPPDPLVDNKLTQIYQLLVQLYQNSGTTPPSTSWKTGIAHPGLSGTGSFNLATGVTAVRAEFTTIPPDIQITPGTPTFYWSLGFVTPTAATYPLRSLRTVFASQDMPLPVQADGLSYTLPPGVVVTLTELLPA